MTDNQYLRHRGSKLIRPCRLELELIDRDLAAAGVRCGRACSSEGHAAAELDWLVRILVAEIVHEALSAA